MSNTTLQSNSSTAARPAVTSPVATNWEIDASHSSAQFSVRHLMVSNVRGEFTKVSGRIYFDAADVARTTVEASIDAASINTREPKRDAHLKSVDFFEVDKYPEITFRSKRVAGKPGALKITGDLTIHGATREVVLDVDGPTPEVRDPWGGVRIGASAKTVINRKDFGLTWNAMLEAGGVMVGDEVKITLDLEAIRK